MKKLRARLVLIMCLGLAFVWSVTAHAEYYDIGGQEIEVDGLFRQEVGYNLNDESPVNQEGIQSAYSMLLVETAAEFGAGWDARLVTRLWADWAYVINQDDSHWKKYFRGAREEHEFFDEFNDIVREAYITYSSSKFQIRIGRQQIGWGESDGLRLMDVVNPLDVRRGGPFYDTQGYSEVRIPKWLLKTEYYPDTIGSITDIALQLIWNPGDVKEQDHLQIPKLVDYQNQASGNAVALPNSGGAWAVPTGQGIPFPVDVNTITRDDDIKNSEFGARLSFTYAEKNMSLNFWHGFAHERLTKFNRIDFHPEGVMTPMAPVPLAVYHDFIYPRVTYAGFTFNSEAPIVGKILGVDSNPIIRLESLYSFDQNINTNEEVPNPAGGPPLDIDKIMESDQFRYMIGFDWSVRWPWINPEKTVFLSGQFFHIHTFDSVPNGFHMVADASPYKNWEVPRDEYYYTLLLATDYMHEKLSPSILYVENTNTNARWFKANVTYKIGSHWRPSITWLFIDGQLQEHAFALYRERDEISFKIEYLF